MHSIIQTIEEGYRAISDYLDNKRKEFPRFYLLNNNELSIIYMSKDLSNEIKEDYLKKIFPWRRDNFINIY